jgi:hypothetical protein
MELPDEEIISPTFRRVHFADLQVGEEYFVKYRSSNKDVDQYVMISDITAIDPLTVFYIVTVERDVDYGFWNTADYMSEATKPQVNGKYAGIEAHFYVLQTANNDTNNGNEVQEDINTAAQNAILASISRPLRPGQRLLLNRPANGTLPSSRVVTRRRQKRRKPVTRRRRRHH